MQKLSILLLLICVGAYFIGCGDESYPPMNEILALTLKDTTNMKANGKYKFTVSAKIPGQAKDSYHTVTFSTSSGTFESSGKDTAEKQVDSEGNAEVSVVVGTTPGKFYVTASIGLSDPKFSVSEHFRLLALSTMDIINVEMDGITGLVADGESIVTFKENLSNTPIDMISVTATEGTFLGSGKETDNSKVDQDGKASFFLKVSQEPGKYFITSSISDGVRITSEISVARAYADSLLIEPNTLTAGPKTAVELSVYLKRANGKVSNNTPVSFKAYQLSGTTKTAVGRFTGIAQGSDTNGKVVVSFYGDSANIDAAKSIFIEVSTPTKDDDPKPYTKTLELNFKEP